MKNEITVHVGGRICLYPSSIILLESDSNYTRLYLNNGKILIVATTLGKIQNRLSNQFVRTHRSFVVNLNYTDISFLENEPYVKMSNNKRVMVSRRMKQKLLESYQKLLA
ncbi:LytTR family transcriptional regulator [Lacihabitans sp. LS3-19]|uniref:LytR/AlgR family response regulator transcription factor n=1 Tax=Lacihabitans sp. LS3-19 TaxID=2487335 RepID=UPI0020CBCE1C|nr:LytTR family DNA-binding domain-containing protein [Lacihabitans sp. LS3-19]MCP9768959.1 LytTR family transcriptional regulator [Lacihabitans sp. LS3-19]